MQFLELFTKGKWAVVEAQTGPGPNVPGPTKQAWLCLGPNGQGSSKKHEKLYVALDLDTVQSLLGLGLFTSP